MHSPPRQHPQAVIDKGSSPRVLEDIEAIEQAVVAQWSNFGLAPGGDFHDEGDLVWTDAPVPQLPYNAVLRTRLGGNADARIEQVVRHFQKRGVQFAWIGHPTAEPDDLEVRLKACGLSAVEHFICMALDLATWMPLQGVGRAPGTCEEVNDERGLLAYEALMHSYWAIPQESQPHVLAMSRWVHQRPERGTRWVSYLDGKPVGKAFLSFVGHEGTASIFGVYVEPAARGLGIAGGMVEHAIRRAIERGYTRVVLHSSAEAVTLYRRFGFVERCALAAYATAPLHSTQSL
jgi:GNAT superfamily N-acetyltransferase